MRENSKLLFCFAGRTRTKDKYRVVYSDHQRLELEKEFHYSRYITIRRKAELAQALNLSERQVSHFLFVHIHDESIRCSVGEKSLVNHRNGVFKVFWLDFSVNFKRNVFAYQTNVYSFHGFSS